MSLQSLDTILSEEEYLQEEQESDTRHEYVNGRVYEEDSQILRERK